MRKLVLGVAATLAMGIVAFASAPAQAAEPRLLGNYSDWSAYVFTEGGNKVCYMASRPKKEEGNYTSRDPVYALITHRPAEGSKNVFSYITGYSYKAGSDVVLQIDSTKYSLFTQDETAWAPDAETDTRITNSIRRGSKMSVKGTSSRGTLTTDTFGLKGSAAAYEAISKECGV